MKSGPMDQKWGILKDCETFQDKLDHFKFLSHIRSAVGEEVLRRLRAALGGPVPELGAVNMNSLSLLCE
jgi:hypothetical protein